MIVYGDAVRMESPRAMLASLLMRVERIGPSGIVAHADLVAAFVEAAELAQGLADVRFREDGRDQASPERTSAASLLQAFADAIERSWNSGLIAPPLEPILDALDVLGGFDLPPEIACRRAEGYAHYAVYPEAYLEAAARLGPGRIGAVIGLRSIGIGLAAMVAAGARAPLPVSARPTGHPFRRHLELSEELVAEITAGHWSGIGIVDEGPGLSGSSFAAVADLLEARGVPAARIHIFPSHHGDPGPKADPRHLRRWRAARRHVVTFDEIMLDPSDTVRGLAAWFNDLVGRIDSVEDVSGGAWRAHLPISERDWPPAHPQHERRKFLLRTARGDTWLARFAGHGSYGEGKLERALALADAGLAPETAGMRHGFILQRWYPPKSAPGVGENDAMATVARYLGFRARTFSSGLPGASLETLASMLLHNAREALGEDVAAAFEVLAGPRPRLAGRRAPGRDRQSAPPLGVVPRVGWPHPQGRRPRPLRIPRPRRLSGHRLRRGRGLRRVRMVRWRTQSVPEAGRGARPRPVEAGAPCVLFALLRRFSARRLHDGL